MILYGRNGEEFCLKIIKYEFPDKTNDEWDSNWLLVETRAKAKGKIWTTTEPCMLTWEVSWLANWLEDILNGESSNSEVSFLEPNLYFELMEYKDKQVVIRVHFELENKPEWVKTDGNTDIWIDLTLSSEQIEAWKNDLRIQRDNFPPRAGVGTRRDIQRKI